MTHFGSMFRGNETISIVGRSAGAVDEYGIPTQTSTTVSVANCLVEFDSTTEPVLVDSDPIIQSATLYIPTAAVIDPMDEFIIRGDNWVKNGAVMEWLSPFRMSVKYSVVKVRRRLA